MADEKTPIVEVRPDRLVAIAKCEAEAYAPEEFADAVLDEAERNGIDRVYPREDLARIYRERLESREKPMELIVARGAEPTPPTEAVLDWAGDFFSREYVQNQTTGAVDFRQYKSNPSVVAGQLLLTVTPAEPGTDGVDVFGKRILAARPRPVRVRAGRNVRFTESANTYEAEQNGRVRFIANVLSVDDIFTVTGNVGLATGNIDHPGALEVQGNIEADSQVRCLGHVKVSGYIETADVESGGNLEVASGLTGIRRGPIKAAGTVRSRFIIDAEVIAGGDVWVDREIVHSVVTAGEHVLAREGRIVGGRVYGRYAIETRDAGSPALVPTLLTVGRTEAQDDELRAMEQRRSKLSAEADRICSAIEPVRPVVEQLPAEKRDAIKKLIDTEQSMREEIARLEHELELRKSAPRPVIAVRGVVHPETTVCIDQVRLHIRELVTGPLVARRVGDRIHLENT